MTKPKPELHLIRGSGLTVETIATLYERLTGRKPTKEEIESAVARLNWSDPESVHESATEPVPEERATSTSDNKPASSTNSHERSCVLHIPHSSVLVPVVDRSEILLDDNELAAELRRMTDAFTDELVATALPSAQRVRFPVSRLVVDPERFANDNLEPMSRVGMGVIYERTSDGVTLRSPPDDRVRQRLLETYYKPHHAALADTVERALQQDGKCLVLDIHSFPAVPLPYELDQARDRPDICIGTDDFHTPPELREEARAAFEREGFSVAINRPFAGALVPMTVYSKDQRVQALMIEVNRRLYMNEEAGTKSEGFDAIRDALGRALSRISGAAPSPGA